MQDVILTASTSHLNLPDRVRALTEGENLASAGRSCVCIGTKRRQLVTQLQVVQPAAPINPYGSLSCHQTMETAMRLLLRGVPAVQI